MSKQYKKEQTPLSNEEMLILMKEYNEFLNTNESEPQTGVLLGWICPKCGAALSPFVNYCVKCSGNWEFTWGTGTSYNIPTSSECNGGNE